MKVKIVTQIQKKQLKADGSFTVQSIVIFKMFSSVLRCLHEQTVRSCDCMTAILQTHRSHCHLSRMMKVLQISTLVGCYSNGTLLKLTRKKSGSIQKTVFQRVPELHCVKCKKFLLTQKLLHKRKYLSHDLISPHEVYTDTL